MGLVVGLVMGLIMSLVSCVTAHSGGSRGAYDLAIGYSLGGSDS